MIAYNQIPLGDGDTRSSIATQSDGSPEIIGKSASKKTWTGWLARNSEAVGISIVLLMLFAALFDRAVYFVPSEPNDLRFISQVAKTSDPLKYLIGDWGEGPYVGGQYGMYRPIHPISLWLVYKFFGVDAKPNQLINLGLHFANVLVLLMIILRIQKDRFAAMLYAALFMVSMYTVSPAIWVTNRALLQVGLALLLLIHHALKSNEIRAPLKTSYVLFLSCFALLSKESGLIVPLFALVVSLYKSSTTLDRIRRATPYALIIGFYFLMRFFMFGSHSVNYHNGGYLFGIRHYNFYDDLPANLRTLSLVDNVLKNLIAPFVPLFGVLGQLDFGRKALIVIIATIALVVLSIKRPTILQMYCLVIIVLNAVLHFQIFRERSLYLAQIAFCLFVASGTVVETGTRRWVTIGLASTLLLVNILQVDHYIQGSYLWRDAEMNVRKLQTSLNTYPGRIDPEIAKRVLEYYKVQNIPHMPPPLEGEQP